ncbi:hypothetical protein ACFLVN_03905, partial [Chloroflexota bacterium]
LGQLGGWALHFLGCTEGADKIITSDINEELGLFKTNVAAIASAYQGFNKKFEFHANDINDIDATAKLLEKVKPDAILLAVAIQSVFAVRKIPFAQDIRDKLHLAGFGAWLPFHLLLPAKFMQALKKSGIQTHVVNSSFPDVVGPVLWKHFGFGPTVGGGNHGRVAMQIIRHVSITEEVPIQDVILYFVGSHSLAERGSKEGIPFFLKILVGDRDITSKYDSDWLVNECPINPRTPLVRQNVDFRGEIGAGYAKNVKAIIRDTNELINTPSPGGLIGGYPARLSLKGAEVVLPEELTLEQAIKINEEAEKFDGIEKIKDDGTVVFTDKTYSIMRELGYDCRELPIDELEPRSRELKGLIKKLLSSERNE